MNNNDLISRQAAIDMLNRLADDPWNANANTTWSKAYGYAAEMIEELPSAEPSDIAKNIAQIIKNELDMHELLKPAQPKKGKWIYIGIRGRFPACQCSECGNVENADWASMQGVYYCPHCGAEMINSKEGGDE